MLVEPWQHCKRWIVNNNIFATKRLPGKNTMTISRFAHYAWHSYYVQHLTNTVSTHCIPPSGWFIKICALYIAKLMRKLMHCCQTNCINSWVQSQSMPLKLDALDVPSTVNNILIKNLKVSYLYEKQHIS